jgi:2-polyprenyl-6-methoxyphenol hydroxylase-like FAD-dependent oxidoreductase
LTLAIALRDAGVAVEVYEQAAELGEVGAAVGLVRSH